MILATFCLTDGIPRVGVVRKNNNTVVDIDKAYRELNGTVLPAFESMLALIESGIETLELISRTVGQVPVDAQFVYCLDDIRLLAPVPVPPQIRDFSVFELHMQQAGAGMARIRSARTGSNDPLPTPDDIVLPESFYQQPIYYKANRFSVVGQDHEVNWPRYAKLLDYELEFGIYLSKSGRNIPVEKARDYIFGFTIYNDISARDAQEYEMTCPFGPSKGKDFDTGNVMGPWIVTTDELPDPYALTMIARVNGEEWSRGSSSTMIHRFEKMIAHVSQEETLYPGEFFGSGTVGGGCGLEINRWLKPGDVVELEVEGIGVLRNRIVQNN